MRIAQIILGIIIVILCYYIYDSIQGPVRWKNEKDRRYTAIKKELLDIRDAQIVYKGENGHYAKTFAELRYFLKKGKVKRYFKTNVPGDTALHYVYRNPADSIFGKGYNATQIGYVPYSHNTKSFDITILEKENIEYIEISDPDPFDPDDPLSVGSTIEPTLRASWESR